MNNPLFCPGAVVLLCLRQVPQQILHLGAAQRPHGDLEDTIHVTSTKRHGTKDGGPGKRSVRSAKHRNTWKIYEIYMGFIWDSLGFIWDSHGFIWVHMGFK